MDKQFKFSEGFRAPKGVDPAVLHGELQTVMKDYGILTAENVVDYASKNPGSLRTALDWDNESAANKYRLQQAYQLIRCVVVVEDKKEPYRCFTLVGQENQNIYLPTQMVVSKPDLLEDGLRRLRKELESARNSVNELIRVAAEKNHKSKGRLNRAGTAIDKAVDALKK